MFKCLYLQYQSCENWSIVRDILRCNPSFYDRERYDCTLINMASNYGDFTCARVIAIFRCKLPSGSTHDIAAVRLFKRSQWKPKTIIDGCPVLDEANVSRYVMIKYLTRGVHMIPVFDTKDGRFILNDVVDFDIFLRVGN